MPPNRNRPPQGPDQQEDVQIAMETCPVDCIHWVG
jgi:ferredoxin